MVVRVIRLVRWSLKLFLVLAIALEVSKQFIHLVCCVDRDSSFCRFAFA